jgi:hypothetical protein
MDRIRARLTFANVVSAIALFFALGGSAYATFVVSSNADIAPNTISGHAPPSGNHANVIAGSLTTSDLADATVTGPKVEDNSLTGSKINESSLSGVGTGFLGGEWIGLVSSAGSVGRSPVGRSNGPQNTQWLAPTDMKILDFRAKITSPPGAGNSRVLGLVAEDTSGHFLGSLHCTVSGASDTTCHTSGSMTVPAGALLGGSDGATGSITSSASAWFGYRVVTP